MAEISDLEPIRPLAWASDPPSDPILADAELFFFPAYTQPYYDPEELAHARFRQVIAEAIAAAEVRGREAAEVALIEALRDEPTYIGWRKWLHDSGVEPRPVPLATNVRGSAASFLEWFVAEVKKEAT